MSKNELDLSNPQVRKLIISQTLDLNLSAEEIPEDFNMFDDMRTAKVLIDVRIPRHDQTGNRAIFILRDSQGDDVFCVSQSNFDEVKTMIENQGMIIERVNYPDEVISEINWFKHTNILKVKNGR